MKSKGKRSGDGDLKKANNLSKPLKSKKKKTLKLPDIDDSSLSPTLDGIKDNPTLTSFKKSLKSPKVPKVKRQAVTEDAEANFMIVPWGSQQEWDAICLDFHSRNYEHVISNIGVWQKRVPSLPVGVEATLFLLEAIVYDQKFLAKHLQSSTSSTDRSQLYTEDQGRSLYSLAIIRYLNHVSHLAAQSLGESSTRPTRELAALVDTPDWIVTLRNEISHGSSAPSIEVLRTAGDFVLEWLKTKYWKLPEESRNDDSGDLLTISGQGDADDDVPSKVDELLAAYIAARIYKLRHIYAIDDEEIVKHISIHNVRIKTKTALTSLRKRLRKYLKDHPSVFCTVFCQSLIPTADFLESFGSILRKNKQELDEEVYVFQKFYGVWLPILKMLQNKGKLLAVLNNLCEIVINPETEKIWRVAARWIDKILEIIENSGKKYANTLTRLMGMVIKHPNDSTPIFLDRFFRLTEPRLGSAEIGKLGLLVAIALEDLNETKKRKRQSEVKLFTVNDIEGIAEFGKSSSYNVISEESHNGNAAKLWGLDVRGEDFWRKVPIGAVL